MIMSNTEKVIKENEQFILENSNQIKSANSCLENVYEHMVKYIFAGAYQDSQWINDISHSVNDFSSNLYRNAIGGKPKATVVNGVDVDKCLKNGIKVAIRKIKKEYNINVRDTEVYNFINSDSIIWRDILAISDRNLIGNWLRNNWNKSAIYADSVSQKILNVFGK